MSWNVLRVLCGVIITLFALWDDMKRYRISNKIVTAGLGIAVVVNSWEHISGGVVGRYVLGGVTAFLIMLVAYGVMAVGAGDVKLAGVLGLLLGMDMMFRVLILAFLYTGVFGTVLSFAGKARKVELAVGRVHTIRYSIALLFGQAFGLLTMYTEVWI